MFSNKDGAVDIEETPENSERLRRMKKLMQQISREEIEIQNQLPPIKAKNLIIFFSFIAMLAMGITTLYNYNRFILLQERVFSAQGHVEDALQRRMNLFGNLVALAINQSLLEQDVFRHVADVRTEINSFKDLKTELVQPDSGFTLPNGGFLDKLIAVVEQYPNIQTSVTYQKLMDKLMNIENRIALRRDEYNEDVRIYNTLISSYPWYILAQITGFERHLYFHSVKTDNFKVPQNLFGNKGNSK